MMDTVLVQWLLERIWVPFLGLLAWLAVKLFGMDKRLALLEERFVNTERSRSEAELRRFDERRADNAKFDRLVDKIDDHHRTIYSKLDSFSQQITVKNND